MKLVNGKFSAQLLVCLLFIDFCLVVAGIVLERLCAGEQLNKENKEEKLEQKIILQCLWTVRIMH